MFELNCEVQTVTIDPLLRTAAIDIGLANIVTIVTNVGTRPISIMGGQHGEPYRATGRLYHVWSSLGLVNAVSPALWQDCLWTVPKQPMYRYPGEHTPQATLLGKDIEGDEHE